MQIPLYKEIHEQYKKDERVLVNENSHRGLYFDKFFDKYTYSGQEEKNWKIEDTAKSEWIKAVSDLGQCGNEIQLKQQVTRLLNLIVALKQDSQTQVFKTTWHFATGLGLPHPVENGLIWHPTLGVPYLPASSIKGLLKAWQRDWMDKSEDQQTKIDEWFGTQEKAGKLIFFDAIPIEPVTLIPDVMTPHYGKWYEQGNEIASLDESKKIPADWHNPVPVPFLAVKKASFLFIIMPRKAADAKEAENAITALTEALKTIGAGAKTAVGYGYFEKTEYDSIQTIRAYLEESSLSELRKEVRTAVSTKDLKAAEEAGEWRKKASDFFGEGKEIEATDIAVELKIYYQGIWNSKKEKDIKKVQPLKDILKSFLGEA